jgi:acetoin utilization protein AcuB
MIPNQARVLMDGALIYIQEVKMLVHNYMTRNPITISPDATFPQAVSIIRKNHIRHLPVVQNNRLVGIVVEKDLLSNQPSQATTLSVYEIYSLLESLHIRQIMTHPVITVEGSCPVEEAARIMVENKVSCLPIMDGNNLVGIITETDIFKVLVDILGGQETGFRITIKLPERLGELAAVSARIAEAGGNIVAVTSSRLRDNSHREVMIKEIGADRDSLLNWLDGCGFEVVDVRDSQKYQPKTFE